MKNLMLTVFIFLTIAGCRTYREFPREFVKTNDVHQSYVFEIHLANLKNRVADQDTFYVSDFMITQSVLACEDKFYDGPLLDIEPQRFFEMVDVIRHDFKVNHESYCQKITILEYEEGSSLPLKLLTAFTMGIPCLAGMPANRTSTAVKIQHACYDDSGGLISSTWAEGYNKTFVAMYWGYGADARTRSNKLAVKEALENLKH